MRKNFFIHFIALCIVFPKVLISQSDSCATIYNNVWHLYKESAIESSIRENKNILFVWGEDWCYNTQTAIKNAGTEPLRSQLNEKYIFWFCNAGIRENKTSYWFDSEGNLIQINYSKESGWALKEHDHLVSIPINQYGGPSVIYPVVAIMSPDRIDFPVSRRFGKQITSKDSLQSMLVSIESITIEKPVVCHYQNGTLFFNSGIEQEEIRIFSLSGTLIATFQKPSASFQKQITLPKGICIISSNNWTKTIIVNK